MKAICLMGDSDSKSGVGKYIRTLLAAMGKGQAIATSLNTEEVQSRPGVMVSHAQSPIGPSAPRQSGLGTLHLLAGYARELLRVAGLIRRQAPPGAILHVNHMGCEVDAIAARWFGRRQVVGTLHVLPGEDPASQFWVRRLIEYASLWSAGRLIAISEAVAAAWAERVTMDPGRISIIYNGVERTPWPPRSQVNRNAGTTLIVGTTGRLHSLKGQDSIIRAFALLPKSLGDMTRLVFVGDGPFRDALQSLARELGVHDRVTFTGHVDDPSHELRRFDVFVSASRYEGMSLSLAEAMLDGLPCVVTESGGMTELIRKSGGGLMVPIGNDALLAEVLSFYLRHPERRERDGQRGREFARQHLTADVMYRQTAQVYELLSGR